MVRLLIAAGGTGGHVYPALAVVEALLKMQEYQHEAEIYFVGGVGGMELNMVTQSGIRFAGCAEVRSGPLHGVGAGRAALSLAQMAVGTAQALRLLRRWRPNAILMTGGWVNVPVALAAWLLRVPSMIYLPDIEPGLAIKTLRHVVKRVAVTVEDSRAFFRSGQAVVTGYPLRQSIIGATREQGMAFFQLKADKRTLLVFGGSRGARTINTAVSAVAPDLRSRCQNNDRTLARDGDAGGLQNLCLPAP
jgi:UDP-N-acetylglucosamine--N-acetylmuramyl-(pentapeptide) pyrophosphoryl-undecaprenol N-acetylglucosamine transferase